MIAPLGFALLLSVTVVGAQESNPAPAPRPAPTAATNSPDSGTSAGGNRLATRKDNSITGRVISDDGQPLAQAQVWVTGVGAGESDSSPARTDDQGNFKVTGIGSGSYRMTARVPGYVAAPGPAAGRDGQRYVRAGEAVTLRMIKGGVITGRVTDPGGEPIIGARVRAVLVRTAEGRRVRSPEAALERLTDDRGVYRLFGLEPGSYLVVLRGQSLSLSTPGMENEAPVYFPSSTRDTAKEVTVRSGEEVSSIDIRHRGERGRAVSGSVSGGAGASGPSQTYVTLVHVATGTIEAVTYLWGDEGGRGFAFYGVPDGEYDLIARLEAGAGPGAISPPHRVSVRGADVTGVNLRLLALGSISGRLILEPRTMGPRPACDDGRSRSLGEAVILVTRDEQAKGQPVTPAVIPSLIDASPGDRGEFLLPDLGPGPYRIEVRLPHRAWYVRAITSLGAAGKPLTRGGNDVGRDGLVLKSGQRVEGLTISLAEGAAQLRGRVGTASGTGLLPSRWRVHLVPAETDYGNETLRFAETRVAPDGSFDFQHIAPGGYWLLLRPAIGHEGGEGEGRPLAWDSDGRAELRREAEAKGQIILLQPCQRMTNVLLPQPPASPPRQR